MKRIYLYIICSLSVLSINIQSSPVLAIVKAQPVRVKSKKVVTTNKKITRSIPEKKKQFSQLNTVWQTAQSQPDNLFQQQNDSIVSSDEQMPSVYQLKDVKPTDWAFEALKSLTERYGVISGYGNGTFQGDRPMTRYEFAAALNAVLDRINEKIQTDINRISRDDLITIKRLKDEFAKELITLRQQVDSLEKTTAFLEANQFSTTTKLTGQAIFAVNAGSFSGDRITDSKGTTITDNNPNATFIYRVALDLNTSFSGQDLLKIRLDTGSNGSDDNTPGFLEPNLGSVLDFSAKPPTDNFGLARLYYTFTPFKNFTVSLGPDIRSTDYVDRNKYANLSFKDFNTQMFVNNYILFPINGPSAGAAIDWASNDGMFHLRALYAATDAANTSNQGVVKGLSSFTRLLFPNGNGDRGLFGDFYQGTIELEYAPSTFLVLRLQYSGGEIFSNHFDVAGVNFELMLSQKIALFGRYGYGSYDKTTLGDIDPQYWMAGISIQDLFRSGATAGLAFGQPFIANELGNATQSNLELFYSYPVNENIQITPSIQVITNPANQDNNGTIVTGTLRTVFSF